MDKPFAELLNIVLDAMMEGRLKRARDLAKQSEGRITIEDGSPYQCWCVVEDMDGVILSHGPIPEDFMPKPFIDRTVITINLAVVRTGWAAYFSIFGEKGDELFSGEFGELISLSALRDEMFRLTIEFNLEV